VPDVFLQDTSFWILANRRRGPEDARARFRELLATGQLAINEMVRLEILLGYKTRDDVSLISDELESLRLLPTSRDVWNGAERLGFDLQRAGVRSLIPDLVIAATAIHHNATLLHADSDFERIAQHSDLRTESHLDSP